MHFMLGKRDSSIMCNYGFNTDKEREKTIFRLFIFITLGNCVLKNIVATPLTIITLNYIERNRKDE